MTDPPPARRRVPHAFTRHGVTIEDPYAWLRDPGYPEVNDAEVLGYLECGERLFRSGDDAASAAGRHALRRDEGPHQGRRFERAAEGRRFALLERLRRRRANIANGIGGRSPAAADAVILDEPELAAGHEYFRLGGHAVSPDGRLLAYAVDTNGSERFVLKVRDLATGADLPDVIENWRYGLVWAADSKSFLYTDADEHWRSKTVWHHRLGDPQSADRDIYREPDAEIRRLARPHPIAGASPLISTGDHATNEVRLLPTGRLRRRAGPGLAAQDRPALRRRRARRHALHPRQRHPSEFPGGDGAGRPARRLDRADRRATIAITSSASPPSRT